MKTLRKQVEMYQPYNRQEEQDRREILKWIDSGMDILTRDNTTAHLTASAWVVNPDHTKTLMVYHNLYDSWSWMGGHADGEKDPLMTALREVKEESGIHNVRPLSDEIFSMEVLTVDGHVKKGRYVSSHLHLNLTYLLEADDQQETHMKADENSGVRWFELDEAVEASTELWFRTNVYSKLNEKLRKTDGKQ
ncbi:MAG: NUDIX hydrolase [Bulleidia sp.]